MLRVGVRAINVDGEARQPGEPIPEAREWPNLRAYLETGSIVIDDSQPREEGVGLQSVHSEQPVVMRRSR
jgi:hypothetical protein